jgi:hypothetical protein
MSDDIAICPDCMQPIYYTDDGRERCGCPDECPCGCGDDPSHCVYRSIKPLTSDIPEGMKLCPYCNGSNMDLDGDSGGGCTHCFNGLIHA